MRRKRSDGDAYPDWGELRVLTDYLANNSVKDISELTAYQDPLDCFAGIIIDVPGHADDELKLC
jgi:hypothetical protein